MTIGRDRSAGGSVHRPRAAVVGSAVLHTDAPPLPRAPAARNHRMGGGFDNAEDVHVSYHLNRLQGLDDAREYLVTLHQRVLERGAP